MFALEPLLQTREARTCSSVVTASAGLLLAITAAAAASIVCFFRSDYRRKAAAGAGRDLKEREARDALERLSVS